MIPSTRKTKNLKFSKILLLKFANVNDSLGNLRKPEVTLSNFFSLRFTF